MKAKTEAKIEAKKEEGPERRRPIPLWPRSVSKKARIESQVPRLGPKRLFDDTQTVEGSPFSAWLASVLKPDRNGVELALLVSC